MGEDNNNLNDQITYELNALAATIPDIVYRINDEGKFTYINPAIRKLGYEPDELIGKHFSELIFPADVKAVSRKYVLPKYLGKITGDKKAPKLFDERRSAERKTSGLEVRLFTRSKPEKIPGVIESISRDYIIAEVSSSGIYQANTGTNSKVFIGSVGVIKDVTAHRWMESELIKYSQHLEELIEKRTDELTGANKKLQEVITELKESECLSKAIIDNSPIGIYIVQDGKFEYVNLPLARTFDYNREQLIGRNPLDLVLPEDRKVVRLNAIQMLRGGPSHAYEYRVLDASGETKWIMETVVSIQYQGRQATLGNFMDITERKQAEEALKKSHEQLQKTLDGITRAIAATVELRDPYTAGHQKRVAQLARTIAQEMNLTQERYDQIYIGAFIHDIGKISIPSEILSRPGKLNELEYSLIKVHSQAGYEILKNIDFPYPVARWVLEHHEVLDGSGYPSGLIGDQISLEARILTVADVVEAISSNRPYRASLSVEEALKEINSNKNKLYDGDVVDACTRLFKERGFKFK